MTNNLLNIKTPTQEVADALKCDYGLENHGVTDLNIAYWNLSAEALYEEITFLREGHISLTWVRLQSPRAKTPPERRTINSLFVSHRLMRISGGGNITALMICKSSMNSKTGC